MRIRRDQLHDNQGVLGAGALQSAEEQSIRQSTTATHDAKKEMRDIKDILHRVEGYGLLTCTCGMKMKIPKGLAQKNIDCPRCGKSHEIPLEFLSAAAIAASHS